jgi:hypothetical protein
MPADYSDPQSDQGVCCRFTPADCSRTFNVHQWPKAGLGGCVAEEADQDTGAEASGAGVDPTAVALALGGASRDTAAAFLKNQNTLIDLQKHHMQRQFTALDLTIWEKRLGVPNTFNTQHHLIRRSTLRLFQGDADRAWAAATNAA